MIGILPNVLRLYIKSPILVKFPNVNVLSLIQLLAIVINVLFKQFNIIQLPSLISVGEVSNPSVASMEIAICCAQLFMLPQIMIQMAFSLFWLVVDHLENDIQLLLLLMHLVLFWNLTARYGTCLWTFSISTKVSDLDITFKQPLQRHVLYQLVGGSYISSFQFF